VAAGFFIEMPMAFSEDLTVYFDTVNGFAVTATLNAVASGAVIFDEGFLRELNIVSGSNPMAMAIAADYAADCVGKTLAIAQGSFVIRDRQLMDDGKLVLLQLERV
jgi:hypothetical protein